MVLWVGCRDTLAGLIAPALPVGLLAVELAGAGNTISVPVGL